MNARKKAIAHSVRTTITITTVTTNVTLNQANAQATTRATAAVTIMARKTSVRRMVAPTRKAMANVSPATSSLKNPSSPIPRQCSPKTTRSKTRRMLTLSSSTLSRIKDVTLVDYPRGG